MTDNHTADDHLSEARLKFLMRDKRYWHPRHADPAFQAMITAGFRRLYRMPGQVQDASTDETGSNGPVHVDAHKRCGIPVSDYYRSRPGQADTPTPSIAKQKLHKHLPPADRDDITPEELYDILDFDPNGAGEYTAAGLSPAKAAAGLLLSKFAFAATEQHFPNAIGHNDEADAFRHAYFSFEMTRNIGADAAKRFGDSHEISAPNPTDERMMDLYNNHVGRQLALDPTNLGIPTAQVILKALKEGRLRVTRYQK